MSLQEHRWSIDAIEDAVVSVEVDGNRVLHLPRWMLPVDAREGDVLRVTHDRDHDRSVLTIVTDAAETQIALERSLAQLRDRRVMRDEGGDIEL